MFDLSPEQVDSVKRRLDFLCVEVGDLAGFHDMSQAGYVKDRDRRSLERLAENVVNATLDIAKVVLASRDLPAPETYRDTVLQLGIAGILDASLAHKIADMVRRRNMLAYQYLDSRWADLRSFINQAPPAMKEFAVAIERLLNVS